MLSDVIFWLWKNIAYSCLQIFVLSKTNSSHWVKIMICPWPDQQYSPAFAKQSGLHKAVWMWKWKHQSLDVYSWSKFRCTLRNSVGSQLVSMHLSSAAEWGWSILKDYYFYVLFWKNNYCTCESVIQWCFIGNQFCDIYSFPPSPV